MKINIYTFGGIKNSDTKDLVEYYLKLSNKYLKTEHHPLPDNVPTEKVLMGNIKKNFVNGFNVVLSERGKGITTLEFGNFLEKSMNSSKNLNFWIGNAFGFEEEIEQNADLLLSLSKMTLPHEFALVVLSEQLFRVLNLINGGKYHK